MVVCCIRNAAMRVQLPSLAPFRCEEMVSCLVVTQVLVVQIYPPEPNLSRELDAQSGLLNQTGEVRFLGGIRPRRL